MTVRGPITLHPSRGALPFHLHSSRLLLRDFSPADFGALASYHRDARYRKYIPPRADVEASTRELLDRFIGWQEEEPRHRFQLAVDLAASGEMIGSVGLRRRPGEPRVADVGFEIAPPHWGQGYGTEAARVLVGYGFSELGLHRVHAHCIGENEASARVLRRIGMRREGVMREHEFFGGRWWDVHWYGMLASEWSDGSELQVT